MKKRKKAVNRHVPMIKASEALELARANDGVAEKKESRLRAAEGAAALKECLAKIHEAAKDGLTEVNISIYPCNEIATNALKGMGYRVYSDGRWNLNVHVCWDPRPHQWLVRLWWDFLNGFWRDSL